MATTTVKLTITSSDLTSDSLSISKSTTLTTSAGAGIQLTSGLNRVNGLNSITTIFAAADYTADEAYLYLSNTDGTKTNQVTLTHGSQKTAVLQGGDSVFMAIDPSAQNIRLTADDATTIVEYQLFYTA